MLFLWFYAVFLFCPPRKTRSNDLRVTITSRQYFSITTNYTTSRINNLIFYFLYAFIRKGNNYSWYNYCTAIVLPPSSNRFPSNCSFSLFNNILTFPSPPFYSSHLSHVQLLFVYISYSFSPYVELLLSLSLRHISSFSSPSSVTFTYLFLLHHTSSSPFFNNPFHPCLFLL